MEDLERCEWAGQFAFECYGVKIGIRFDDLAHRADLMKILPPINREISFAETEQVFSLVTKSAPKDRGFFLNSEIAFEFENFENAYFEHLEAKVLLVLALLSPPNFFYLHAGAIELNGVGIIFPGESCAGKTTLVKYFIENGARYYSDDCAVLDFEGNLHPFPNPISVRKSRQTRNEKTLHRAESFGAKSGAEKVPVGLIIFTEFDEKVVWNPQKLLRGQAVFRVLEHFFYKTSIRRAPAETLRFLANLSENARLFESPRGEARGSFRMGAKTFGNLRI